jgi:hypothetical protein
MIVLKLKGGLGNQLFQYAAAKQLSIVHNMPLLIDLTFFESASEKHTYRKYELDKFNIEVQIASQGESKKINSNILSKLRLNKISEKNYWFKIYLVKILSFGFVRGYWQSEKYFSKIKKLILQDFVFKTDLEDNFNEIKDKISKTNSVSIHFRRGDYVSNEKINKHHGTASLSYYYEAIRLMNNMVKDACFFVFSDDLEWVKANFVVSFPVFYIEKSDEENHSDFQLMSLCKHNIIANSTYSWWAAWLNRNPNKRVIAPLKWYNDRKMQRSIKERIPSSWLTV